MEARYFIKIPGPKGTGEQMVRVDPLKLHSGVLTQLYEWNRREGKYVALLGTESWVKKGLDLTELLQQWSDFRKQIGYAAANQTGVAAEFTQEVLATMVDMATLFQQIADGQLVAADKTLQSIGFGIVQASAVAASELTRLEAQAAQHAGLAEAMVGIVTEQDDRTVAQAQALAESIDDGLEAHSSLVGYESQLDHFYGQLEAKSRSWLTLSQDGPPWLQDQLTWLADDATGFCTRASRYLISPDPEEAEAITEVSADARRRTQLIRERLAAAEAERTAIEGLIQELLGQQFTIDHLIRTIRECREAVDRARREGVDAYTLVAGLITDEEYQRWHATLSDPEWKSLHAASVRLRDKAETIRRLIAVKPRLNDAAETVLLRTSQYAERLEAALADYGMELDEAEAAESRQGAVSTVPTSAVADMDGDRLEELYELMLAIGAVKYCGPQNFKGGYFSSMVDILEALGRMKSEERELYGQGLLQRLEADSHQVQEGTSRLAAWQEVDPSKAHWIVFQQARGQSSRKYTMWRLVEQASNEGLSLCVKHGLDPRQIIAAFDARRQSKRPSWAK